MKVSYKKLWVLLAQKEISKAEFRKMIEVSPSTYTKLNQNKPVALQVIVKIMNTLECKFDDVIEILDDNDCAE